MKTTIRRALAALGFVFFISDNSYSAPEVSVTVLQDHLKKHQSPMTSDAQDIYDAGRQQNIDPRLLLAISGAETEYGKRICTPYNAWNVWHTHEWCNAPYPSWSFGANDTAFRLNHYYLNDDVPKDTIEKIGNKYCERECLTCPKGCPIWIRNVTKIYTELGGCLDDLTFGDPEPGKCAKHVKPKPVCLPLAVLASVNLGETEPKSCTAVKAIPLQNQDGCSALEGTVRTSPPFAVVAGESFSLKSKEATFVYVSFCPDTPGNYSQKLVFETNRGSGITALAGTGKSTAPVPWDGWHCCMNIRNDVYSSPGICGYEGWADFADPAFVKQHCETNNGGTYHQGRCPEPLCTTQASCCAPAPDSIGAGPTSFFGSRFPTQAECDNVYGTPNSVITAGRCE